jgi:general secretion pathway protein M
MLNGWKQLSDRERWLVGGGAALTLIVLGYALVWQPLARDLSYLQQSVAESRSALAWMRQAAAAIQRLQAERGQQPAPGRGAGVSLATLIDRTAAAAGLDKALRQVDPQGGDTLSVRLEQAEFDPLLRWLGVLQRHYRIVVVDAAIERQDTPGRVNARLILQELGA